LQRGRGERAVAELVWQWRVAFSYKAVPRLLGNSSDVNGDGIGDMLIGLCTDDTDHAYGGAAYLLYGGERFR